MKQWTYVCFLFLVLPVVSISVDSIKIFVHSYALSTMNVLWKTKRRNRSSGSSSMLARKHHQRLTWTTRTYLSSSSSSSSSTTTDSSQSSPSKPFSSFQFAANGVCISPRYFVLFPGTTNNNNDTIRTTTTMTPTDTNKSNSSTKMMIFTMRNVPGDGDCMFQAVSLAALASMGLGGNNVLLRSITSEIRSLVATIYESSILMMQQRQQQQNSDDNDSSNNNKDLLLIDDIRGVISTYTLLQSAARMEKMSIMEYIQKVKSDGTKGGLHGGGPELTILSNILRRPISIYHLVSSSSSATSKVIFDDNYEIPMLDDVTSPITTTVDGSNIQYIECVGTFGSKHFADPLLQHVPNSVILSSALQPYGAYSWHLHILIVDSGVNEKHACVLLPQQLEKQQKSKILMQQPSR